MLIERLLVTKKVWAKKERLRKIRRLNFFPEMETEKWVIIKELIGLKNLRRNYFPQILKV